MAIGKKIRFFRTMRGMTQKQLGILAGLSAETADVRMAQYEAGTRTPREELTAALARALDVSSQALTAPCIDSGVELMHMLFALEDSCGVKIDSVDGEFCLRLDNGIDSDSLSMLNEWRDMAMLLERGEITKAEYDHWRYNYKGIEKMSIVGGDRM